MKTVDKVELLDNLGDDLAVVNAARVSLGKESEEFNSEDERLIKYLVRHGHWTPFSQCQIKFRFKMPIFIARQWFRSNVGLTRNEISRRYVEGEPEFYVPEDWRRRPEKSIKQGSSDIIIENNDLIKEEVEEYNIRSLILYNKMLDEGVAPEQARMILPQSLYTEFIETGSLAAYARIYKLRINQDAQKEIQKYALEINEILCKLYPVSWTELVKEEK